MLGHGVFGLVLSRYSILLTALLNKTWVSRAWSPTKFSFILVKAFPIQFFKELLPLDSLYKLLYQSRREERMQRYLGKAKSNHCFVQGRSVDTIVSSRNIKTDYGGPVWYRLGRLRFRCNLQEQIPIAN